MLEKLNTTLPLPVKRYLLTGDLTKCITESQMCTDHYEEKGNKHLLLVLCCKTSTR